MANLSVSKIFFRKTTAYFEKFVAPPPDTGSPESYIRDVLIPYRRALLARDLMAGLDICCLGALRDDLCPGQWVDGFDNDVLWDGTFGLRHGRISILALGRA